jgi:hypothetical protein
VLVVLRDDGDVLLLAELGHARGALGALGDGLGGVGLRGGLLALAADLVRLGDGALELSPSSLALDSPSSSPSEEGRGILEPNVKGDKLISPNMYER